MSEIKDRLREARRNKIASGERQNPRYQIMDGLRDLAKAVKRKTPRGHVGQG